MKVVLDTNVWLSGIFWKGEAYRLISRLEDREAEVMVNKEILLEISKILNEEAKFQKFMEDRRQATEDLIRTVMNMSRIIISRRKLDVIKDHPSDNWILECAVLGKADYLVSYNDHIIRLKEYEGIKIITPSDMLKELG